MNLLLDLLFPKRCVTCGKFGEYICKDCFSKIEYVEKPVCAVCQRQAVGGRTHPGCQSRSGLDGLMVACRYSGPVKAAIAKVKYKWVFDIGSILADLLVSNLWRFSLPSDYVLVPIPLHRRRKNWRGFNQAQLLVGFLGRKFKVEVFDLLMRIADTKSQVGLDKKQRRQNLRGAFAFKKGVVPSVIVGKSLILVDDVYTSGATIMEAAKVLKKAGAKNVWAMTVALG